MCNCKGWDIAYFEEGITVVPHFCRVLDDCGHVNNTLEQAADEVARAYDRDYDWYCDAAQRYIVDHDPEKLDHLLAQGKAWRERTHPDYVFYKEGD